MGEYAAEEIVWMAYESDDLRLVGLCIMTPSRAGLRELRFSFKKGRKRRFGGFWRRNLSRGGVNSRVGRRREAVDGFGGPESAQTLENVHEPR